MNNLFNISLYIQQLRDVLQYQSFEFPVISTRDAQKIGFLTRPEIKIEPEPVFYPVKKKPV